ncbi:MAG: LCCL domain-containing protein [Anaerolineae bacterium]|jgi:hypothetical protein|nr:LCCL domain-containing protein [Anaerolineae bacterium]
MRRLTARFVFVLLMLTFTFAALPLNAQNDEDEILTDDLTAEDGSIIIANLPEGVVQLRDGAMLEYPDGWVISSDSETLYDTVSLIYGDSIFNYSALLTITLNSEDSFPIETYREGVLGFSASLYTGKETFDPETDLITEELEDGRIFESLVVPEYEEGISALPGNSYTLILDGQYWANALLVVINPDDIETVLADSDAILRSMVMTLREGALMVDGRQIDAQEADCFTGIYASESDPIQVYDCPANCAADAGAVWGTDIYTSDSSVCAAAIHAGVITDADGGLVIVRYEPGLESYTSTTRNGITTEEYGAWDPAATVAPFTEDMMSLPGDADEETESEEEETEE